MYIQRVLFTSPTSTLLWLSKARSPLSITYSTTPPRFPCIWSIHSGGNSIFQRRICWNHLKLRIDIHIFYIELRLMRFMWLLPRQSLRQPPNYRWICKTAGYPSDCPHKSYCICGTYVHLNSNFMWPTRVWPLLNTVGPGVLSAP